jgi:hypothetical protein
MADSIQLQDPTMTHWQSHIDGLQRIIEMRGGFKTLVDQSPQLAPALVTYTLYVIESPLKIALTSASIVNLANTCSPSCKQISLTGTLEQHLDDITELYTLFFPFTLCPQELYLAIIRINDLRKRAAAALAECKVDPNHPKEAYAILRPIEDFAVNDWAQPGKHHDEWLSIVSVYQSTLAVYCIMSLQSFSILPNSPEMDSKRALHGDQLLKNLKAAVQSPRLVNVIMWPLTVAGVEAGYRAGATQYWIGKQLEALSRVLGTNSPLKARTVLRRYWSGAMRGWDECFDQPYVFIL